MPPRNDASGSGLPRATNASAAYSIYPTDSVQDTAEALGLPPLRDGVAAALAADVEYRLRQVVQDASKFMRHGKRQQLRVCDIDRALRQRNIDPIFGFHPTTLGKASTSGAYPTPVGSTFRRIQTQSGPIHLVADEEIDLEKVLEGGPQVALGPGVGWSAHWLAVEGVQPAVPQNPVVGIEGEDAAQTSAAGASAAGKFAGSNMVQPSGASAFVAPATAGPPGQAMAKPLIKHVLSRELQLYFERLTNAIIDPPAEADVEDDGAADRPLGADGDTSMADGTDSAVTAMTERRANTSGNTVRDAALASLRGDSGLHQLVPYLIQWIGERVQNSLRDEAVLDLMLYTTDALISNPFLGIEPYLHQLLPFVLSILLTASLGSSPSSTKAYALRVQAGAVLNSIVSQYSATYPTLKPRIVRTIMSALDAGCAEAARTAGANGSAADAHDDDEDGEGRRARSETPSAHGPRESASTKLGAVIGLHTLGHSPMRALLVRDASSNECLLKRLGYWCAKVEKFTARREQVDVIVREVQLAFADMSFSSSSSLPSHLLNDGKLDIPEDAEDDDAALTERVGSFWVQRLQGADEARRGLLIALAEIAHAERSRSVA